MTRRTPLHRAACALAAGLFVAGAAAQTPSAADAPPGATWARHEHRVHDVARMGTAAQLRELLQAEPALRALRTPLGATPLHHAALNLDPGPLQVLLEAGAEIEARDGEGRTPLHVAVFAQRRAQVRLLLRAGADPRATTQAGRDVLSLARKVRADEIAGEISLWILKGCSKDKPC